MKRIVAIFAHPDDESLIAGSLAHFASSGNQVSLICTTKGEAGEISDVTLASPENLGAVREQELRCACEVIGISELHFLGYCDSGMDGTPENEKLSAFIQADPAEVKGRLVRLIRSIKPHLVITYEPMGWYGHPDHIVAGKYATEAFYLAADGDCYPDAGPAWQADKLYHAVFLRSIFKEVAEYVRSQGWDTSGFDSLPLDEPDPLEEQITHTFSAQAYSDIKLQAINCHQTQFGVDHVFKRLPEEIWRAFGAEEYFIQVEPPLAARSSANGDLLAGLPGQTG
jgi:LmbE family N-acetylglucosaminyl deacetylase